MPKQGIDYVQRKELLSYEEMIRIVGVLAEHGIEKVRITGGEPFARKDLLYLLERLFRIDGVKKLSITTNGTLTLPYLADLEGLGIKDINLSVDSFDPQRFKMITRQDDYLKVRNTFNALIDKGFNVKVNCVVMGGINDADILPMAKLVYEYPVHVRFIEEMPFNGTLKRADKLEWDHRKILETLQKGLPGIHPVSNQTNATSDDFCVPNALGTIGIIAAYSRTFCGTCDRIRITPTGQMRTCLYGGDALDLRSLLRSGASDEDLIASVRQAIQHRKKDGFEAEKALRQNNHMESMARIGG
jgi:cyclic pyranopterin phosphate synthase